MDKKQLQCFIAVAENLSFSKAAAHLGVTSPAITYQIASLEKDMEVLLLARNRQGVKLTPAGRAFYYEVRDLMEGFERAMKAAKAWHKGELGEISIGVLGIAERRFLPMVLKHFSASHPAIQVKVRCYDLLGLTRALEEGEVEVGFTLVVGCPKGPGFRRQVLFSEPMVVILRRDHPLASRRSLGLMDLRDEPIVQLAHSVAGPANEASMEMFAKLGLRPRVTALVPDFEAALIRVESGQEIAIAPKYRGDAARSSLTTTCPLEGEGLKIDYLAVWPDDSVNPALPLFIQALGILP